MLSRVNAFSGANASVCSAFRAEIVVDDDGGEPNTFIVHAAPTLSSNENLRNIFTGDRARCRPLLNYMGQGHATSTAAINAALALNVSALPQDSFAAGSAALAAEPVSVTEGGLFYPAWRLRSAGFGGKFRMRLVFAHSITGYPVAVP